MYKIKILQTHPIQYYAPLYFEISNHKDISLHVYYCNDYGVSKTRPRYSPELGNLPNWDIDLLQGHVHTFLRNYAIKPSIFKGFIGLINPGILKHLKRKNTDLLIIVGWNFTTALLAVLYCKMKGIKTAVRSDNTITNEQNLSTFKKKLKRFFFGKMLFQWIDIIFFVGNKNRSFFELYCVPSNKLFKFTHAIDNQRFRKEYHNLLPKRSLLREKYKIGKDTFVILFTGRFIQIKNPLDLLKAYHAVDFNNKALIFVGDGPLKNNLDVYISEHNIKNVLFTGYLNQTELSELYTLSDVFVLPSNSETWGLVVNEAMNFNLPVILSDSVGCSDELVTPENGFIVEPHDIDDLTEKMHYLATHRDEAKQMGEKSADIVSSFNYKVCVNQLLQSLHE